MGKQGNATLVRRVFSGFAGRGVDAYRVKFPTGRVVEDYFMYDLTDWVLVVAVTAEGKFLLIKEYRAGFDDYMITPVAATCEKSETFSRTAERELLAEAGYSTEKVELLIEMPMHASNSPTIGHYYLATGCRRVASQDLDPNEKIEVRAYTPEQVLGMLRTKEIIDPGSRVSLMLALEQVSGYEFVRRVEGTQS